MFLFKKSTNNKTILQEEVCCFCNEKLNKVGNIIETDTALECPICESIYARINNKIRLIKKSKKIIIQEKTKNVERHMKITKILIFGTSITVVLGTIIILIVY